MLGYRIVKRDNAPKWIKDIGSPDIIAEKNGKFVLVEIKPNAQFKRHSKANTRFVIVTDVEKGGKVEVWGTRELEKLKQ